VSIKTHSDVLLIHGCKVGHVGEIHCASAPPFEALSGGRTVVFDDFVEGAARELEHFFEVLQDLFLPFSVVRVALQVSR
jgi:hypothetical protein